MIKSLAPVFVALLHHPVLGREGQTITTSITTFDIHDIARTCKTYDIARYFLISPTPSQQVLTGRILDHWQTGVGAAYNTTRKQAIDIVKLVPSLTELCLTIKDEFGIEPRLIGTSAKPRSSGMISFEDLREDFLKLKTPHLLLFGTGWGMAEAVFEQCSACLPPIGDPAYNHLSVRAAVAIILDRLAR